jgi:hypothetical protein
MCFTGLVVLLTMSNKADFLEVARRYRGYTMLCNLYLRPTVKHSATMLAHCNMNVSGTQLQLQFQRQCKFGRLDSGAKTEALLTDAHV